MNRENGQLYTWYPKELDTAICGTILRLNSTPKFDILEEIKMAKIKHVQTFLMEDDIEALKSKTGESTTKEAINKAVIHYLECEYTKVEDMFAKELENVCTNQRALNLSSCSYHRVIKLKDAIKEKKAKDRKESCPHPGVHPSK